MGLLHDSTMGLHVRKPQLWIGHRLDVVCFFQDPGIVVVVVVILPRIVVVVVVIVDIVVVVGLATFVVALVRLPRWKPRLLPLMLFLLVIVVNSK